MKFGVHSYVFVPFWTDECLGILETVRDLGLDAFEIGVGDDVVFDEQATRRRAEQLGLELLISPGNAWPMECDLSSDDPDERAAGLAWHKKQVDRAERLGAVAYPGCLYGHAGVIKRRVPPPDELPRVAEGLHELAEYAQRRGVAIVLEPMSHFRTHLINRPDQLADLLARIDHPNAYALLDTYHVVTEIRDYAQGIRTLAGNLWAIHACENDRGVPGGGIVPWDDVFGALREIGFDGRVVMETYNSTYDGGEFAFSRGMFHHVCDDAEAFIRQGLAFLTDGLRRAGY